MTMQTVPMPVGATSVSVDAALVQNSASAAAGDPILGLAFNTANLQAYYRQVSGSSGAGSGGTPTAISLVTLANAQAAWSSGGFVQVDSVHDPGGYRFDVPNIVLATAGIWKVTFSGAPAGTAGNMETHTIFFWVGMNIFDIVRSGLTSLPPDARLSGTVTNANFTPTSTQFESSQLNNANTGFYIGLSVYASTGALAGQLVGVVTGYSLVTGNGHFTVSGSPSSQAMANGDSFYLV